MIQMQSRLKGVTDRAKWSARGASFVAKLNATKVVWFPPQAVETGKKNAATAKRVTERATKRTTGAAKTVRGTKKLTKPVGQKHT
jgi:hypothetical protein